MMLVVFLKKLGVFVMKAAWQMLKTQSLVKIKQRFRTLVALEMKKEVVAL